MPERTQKTRYRVVHLNDGRVWDVGLALAVCHIIWREPPVTVYAIFKGGRRWRKKITTQEDLLAALKKWNPREKATSELR